MKVRKKVIGIFLLIVVLCLGVGFAALNDTLLIDGTVSLSEDDFTDAFDGNIFFSTPAMAASTVTGETGITATLDTPVISGDKDTLTININAGTFTAVGQAVIATAKIENSSTTNDATIEITATKVNSATEETGSFTSPKTLTVGSFEITLTLSNTTVSKSGSIDAEVKIKLVKLPAADETNTFKFTMTATAVA